MTSDVREGVRHPPTPLRGTNLFDALRIIAAAMVIIGHAWPLSGLSGVPTFAGMKIHHVGVYIFFVISGYLLARSWNRDPRPLAFIVRRALRIFPALFAVILLTILVVGPLLTVQPPGGYWGQRSFWNYFMNFLLLAEYELPGVFVNNPTPPVNGSLWSLGPEFCCYVMLVALALLGAGASRAIRVLLAVLVAGSVFIVPLSGPLRITATAVVCFIMGSLIADFTGAKRPPFWPVCVCVPVMALLNGDLGLLAAILLLPYVVVSIGSTPSQVGKHLHRLGDPSYGMYLWGFPLQQTLISLFGTPPIWVSIAVVLPSAILLGLASWHLIEKRAIQLGVRLSAKKVAHPDPSKPEVDSRLSA